MKQSEEKAYLRYPKTKVGGIYEIARKEFIAGYEQALKDYGLSLKDKPLTDL